MRERHLRCHLPSCTCPSHVTRRLSHQWGEKARSAPPQGAPLQEPKPNAPSPNASRTARACTRIVGCDARATHACRAMHDAPSCRLREPSYVRPHGTLRPRPARAIPLSPPCTLRARLTCKRALCVRATCARHALPLPNPLISWRCLGLALQLLCTWQPYLMQWIL